MQVETNGKVSLKQHTMIKKSIFTLVLMAVIGYVSAQSLRFEWEGNVYEDGATITCTNDEFGYGEYIQHMQMRNLTSNDLNVLVEKEVVEDLEGAMNFFCWGMCFSESVIVSPNAVTVNANSLNTDELSFHVLFDEQVYGKVHMRFYAYDERHPEDRATINVIFHKSGVGVDEVPSCTFSHAYPNPASTMVRFNYELSSNENAVVSVYNLLGQEMMRQELNSLQGQLAIPVSDLQEGIYFCTIMMNGQTLQTEKFIVKK